MKRFSSVCIIILCWGLGSCSSAISETFVRLLPLESQINDESSFHFNYILGSTKFQYSKPVIVSYFDSFSYDDCLKKNVNIYFVYFENGMPFESYNHDKYWLGNDKYKSHYLLKVAYSIKNNTWVIEKYENGKVKAYNRLHHTKMLNKEIIEVLKAM